MIDTKSRINIHIAIFKKEGTYFQTEHKSFLKPLGSVGRAPVLGASPLWVGLRKTKPSSCASMSLCSCSVTSEGDVSTSSVLLPCCCASSLKKLCVSGPEPVPHILPGVCTRLPPGGQAARRLGPCRGMAAAAPRRGFQAAVPSSPRLPQLLPCDAVTQKTLPRRNFKCVPDEMHSGNLLP